GDSLTIEPGPNQESVVVQQVTGAVVKFVPNLVHGHGVNAVVTAGFNFKTLSSAAPAGARVIAVDNRVSLADGDVLHIGAAPHDEYTHVTGLPQQAPTG